MSLSLNRGALSATVLSAALAICAFKPAPCDNNGGLLHAISSPTDKTVLTYNADKSIAKLVTTHAMGDDQYTDVRIPVYQSGKLVKTMSTADESQAPTLFSSFGYDSKGRIDKISYYEENQVSGYDSLVYDTKGQLAARYFFVMQAGKQTFENHYCQLYTWDQKGNIIQQENMGRVANNVAFALSSTVAFQYDDKLNSQKSVPGFGYITDLNAVNLSANNIVSEVITTANGANAISKSYAYNYNSKQYPAQITAKNSGTNEEVVTELTWE
ncbi:hypothetical protein [Chitinophaga sp. LS1]|uniref:hypothetical protein n=1 Tax=Chitinophaga sp. LS1 TaxID=3051176 RepID=UPI002AAA8713|nr:hypothetical protein [Chitinophaga sp. LS1]WPV65561.1 hypothetical protein QQL36_27550 [Chitinophaga sp. LS1]